jgi:hypothetical protein
MLLRFLAGLVSGILDFFNVCILLPGVGFIYGTPLLVGDKLMEFPFSNDASFKSASISYYFGSFDVGTFLVVESPFYFEPLF